MATLGERALAVSIAELERGAGENPLGSNAGPDVAQYFAGCVRDGRPVGITSGPWCAASACWAMYQALAPGETAPHPWRASGIELERDAQELGLWRSAAIVAAGFCSVRPGDLAIYVRTAARLDERGVLGWQRHVARIEVTGPRFTTIGGNEGNRWARTERSIFDADLLGFVVYRP